LKRELDRGALEKLKRTEKKNIGIGGASIASQVLAYGLMDEIYRFIFPIMVGSGKKWLTNSGVVRFDLIGTHEFAGGVVMLHYKIDTGVQRW